MEKRASIAWENEVSGMVTSAAKKVVRGFISDEVHKQFPKSHLV
jgi:hypothetical protein